MGFIDNIIQCLGGESFPKEPQYRAVVFGDNAVYVENVLGIISYQKDKVVLAVKKATLTVSGSELYIKKYCLGDLVVCGKIIRLEKTDSR